MMKTDIAATEANIRAEWARIAAKPEMQNSYGRLQATGYAVDFAVASTLWLMSADEQDADQVLSVGAAMASSFIATLLMALKTTEAERHEILHKILDEISSHAHEALGFSDPSSTERETVIVFPVVMKDVGDA